MNRHYPGHWLHSLLFGSVCYALANGLVRRSDWYYLAASAAVAAAVAAGLRPLHRWLGARPPRWGRARLWALGSTLAVFSLGVLLTFPLRSWPGPGGLWPWGAGALLATALNHRHLPLTRQLPKSEQHRARLMARAQ